MGLDAVVFCDCYEKGRLKRPPPHPGLVYVVSNGDLGCRTKDPKLLDQFDTWRTHACRHEQGMVAGDFLGNMTYVAQLRDALRAQCRAFPILLNKVIYCGTHTGDHLTQKNVQKLALELERLESFRTGEKDLDKDLQFLRRQLEKLVRVALKLKKPIAF